MTAAFRALPDGTPIPSIHLNLQLFLLQRESSLASHESPTLPDGGIIINILCLYSSSGIRTPQTLATS